LRMRSHGRSLLLDNPGSPRATPIFPRTAAELHPSRLPPRLASASPGRVNGQPRSSLALLIPRQSTKTRGRIAPVIGSCDVGTTADQASSHDAAAFPSGPRTAKRREK
jgi:hypothetical protein